jgi:anti-sigma B factor antagonist
VPARLGPRAACFPLQVHAVHIERNGRVVVVLASGELDAFVVTDLETAFTEVGEGRRIVVDLERVSFMDSTALGVLVRRVRELREVDADVRVVLPRGTARRIFEITALDDALPIVADRAAALDELDPA